MPHKSVTFDPWVEELRRADPCLGRVLVEVVVAQEAAIEAGAPAHPSRACRKATLAALRSGKVRPNTDAAWKRAADALRKYTQALDCTAQPTRTGIGRSRGRTRP